MWHSAPMSYVWLPTAPRASFDEATVERFLRAGHPESDTHDYKVGPTSKIARSLSAFANTYGGVVLIGVPDAWTGGLDELVDIDPATEDRIIDSLVDDLDPPWLPEVLRFTIAGKRLMVLRVDPDTAPRPLLAKHVAYLRRERRSVIAAQPDLRALFEGTPPTPIASVRPENQILTDLSSLGPTMDVGAPDFAVRVSGGLDLLPADDNPSRFRMPMREQILHTLTSTPMQDWAARWAAMCGLRVAPWAHHRPSGPTLASFILTLTSAERGGPDVERGAVHVQVALPGSQQGGGVSITITAALAVERLREDASISQTGAIQQGRLSGFQPQIGLEDLGFTLDAELETMAAICAIVEWEILGQPAARWSGPAGSMAGALDRVVSLDGLPHPRPDPSSMGSQRYFGVAAEAPRDAGERHAVINEWLETMLMVMGYIPSGNLWP